MGVSPSLSSSSSSFLAASSSLVVRLASSSSSVLHSFASSDVDPSISSGRTEGSTAGAVGVGGVGTSSTCVGLDLAMDFLLLADDLVWLAELMFVLPVFGVEEMFVEVPAPPKSLAAPDRSGLVASPLNPPNAKAGMAVGVMPPRPANIGAEAGRVGFPLEDTDDRAAAGDGVGGAAAAAEAEAGDVADDEALLLDFFLLFLPMIGGWLRCMLVAMVLWHALGPETNANNDNDRDLLASSRYLLFAVCDQKSTPFNFWLSPQEVLFFPKPA